LFGLKDAERRSCLPDPGIFQQSGYRFRTEN